MSESLRLPIVPSTQARADHTAGIRAMLAKLIAENPELCANLVELRANLASAVTHHRSQELDQAESLYRKILAKVPRHPVALHMLGVIELQRGNNEAAIGLINQAIEVQPSLPEPFVNLGNALRLINKPEEAIESYRHAIALKPDMVLAHSQLAEVLMHLGRYEAAITHLQSAIAIEPTSVPLKIELAIVLRRAGRPMEAAQCWREIIALEPNRPESYYALGLEFGETSQWREALYCHRRAATLQPENPLFHCGQGVALIHSNNAEAAAGCFRAAADMAPDCKEAWAGLGWAYRMLGHFDEADACFQKVRDLDPSDSRAYKYLSTDGEKKRDGAEQQLVSVLERPESSLDDRISAGFGLGRLLDNASRYDEAFPRYAAANALVRESWPSWGDRFDAKTFTAAIDRLIDLYTPGYLAEMVDIGNLSELPVFIVGMPRSGTTLVEQICASHSHVFGAGELPDIARIVVALGAGHEEEQVDSIDRAAAQRLADSHIVNLYSLAQGAIRAVDKMPDNIIAVGLIALLFPRARIIYCSRDDRDIALSCYFQLFNAGAQFFSYDLGDCGRRCRHIARLASHWLKLLPARMIEVNYETLVADPEGQSRRLIEFLGLDWESACLNFHRTERTVTTVSHWQVRQPLYHSSVGRWKHYEKDLDPLFSALNEP
jgi:tetratricopeptide (TPR) repeat protein